MKKKFLSLTGLFLFATLAYSQSSKNYQLFILNDSFSHAQPEGSKLVPKNYQLGSLKGFILDCSKYDFTLVRSMNDNKNPDAIFIVAKSGNYMVELNVSGETIIDNSTMISLDNPKKKFKEFEKGDTPILGIGTLKIKDGQASMTTYWISMIDIK
jgi:hypothetical protein